MQKEGLVTQVVNEASTAWFCETIQGGVVIIIYLFIFAGINVRKSAAWWQIIAETKLASKDKIINNNNNNQFSITTSTCQVYCWLPLKKMPQVKQ